MSGDTLYERPQRRNVPEIRAHDYLYDSTFIVSGARDYARTAFKGAMASAQVIIQPVYRTMFSNIKKYPRMRLSVDTRPRQVLAVPSTTPDFQPQTPECAPSLPHKPRSRGTQSLYRYQ
ncbi:uncharacterized protein LOC114243485 [Bombyx mandarina]|uniref:Uncharacterized protein LOC114243485 n=1 Tax=Bombyx mandarina TaxID=7092 RepID=A0A6J2JP42_BOMMA|nr:uncharacterized protein LOC114243485 [Bombyx mandarina]